MASGNETLYGGQTSSMVSYYPDSTPLSGDQTDQWKNLLHRPHMFPNPLETVSSAMSCADERNGMLKVSHKQHYNSDLGGKLNPFHDPKPETLRPYLKELNIS